jgi:hypothetical protein
MNGDIDISALVENQRRIERKAETAVQAVLDMDGKVSRIEMMVDTMGRDLRKMADQIAVLTANHTETRQKVRSLASIQEEPDDSPSGLHEEIRVRIRKTDKSEMMMAIKKAQELRTWRWFKSTGRATLIAGVAVLGEHLLRWLLHHF